MTKPPEPVVTGELKVTQSDRNAAAPLSMGFGYIGANSFSSQYMIVNGHWDDHPLVQAFARHRTAHALPGDVGTVRVDLEDLLEDIEDEWIDHYLRPDSAERAKCKRCGGDDFFKSGIEHKPGCLVGRIRAALAPSAPPGCPHEAWEDRGGAKCCVDCGIWFEDAATPSALSGDAGEGALGRFGHHPDPAIDFEYEVECCENDAYDLRSSTHYSDRRKLLVRIDRAMSFRVGGDESCISAKQSLRELERAILDGDCREYIDGVIASRTALPSHKGAGDE